MNTVVVNSSIRFVGILLFQVLVLNNIELHGFINPYIYPLAILLLPFNTPKWLLLVLGFCAGLFVDVFANTPGLHAAATVLLAYLRPLIVLVNRPPSDYESSDQPTVNSLGFNWFIIYATIAVLIHHICYFSIEIFSFAYVFHTIARIIGSAIVTLILIVIYEYLLHSK